MDNPIENSVDFAMLGKYLARECSSQEQQAVEEWLQVEENAREFEILRSMWESTDAEPALVNVDAAWEKVEAHVQNGAEEKSAVGIDTEGTLSAQEGETARERRGNSGPSKSGNSFMRVMPYLAAGIALLVVSVLFFWPGSPQSPEMIDFKNTTAETYKHKLPDGSEVTLKYGSSLVYAQNFGQENRELELKGEAFFEVQRDPEKPFTISVEGTEVKVLGTSFNVNPTEGVEVKVATGKVKLSAPQSGNNKPESVVLEAGMAARYDQEQAQITDVREVSGNEFFWVKKRLDYRETPLGEVAKDLRKHYKVKIRFGMSSLKNCPLTTTFENESIDSIILVIKNTFDLTVTQDGNKYLLEGTGCD